MLLLREAFWTFFYTSIIAVLRYNLRTLLGERLPVSWLYFANVDEISSLDPIHHQREFSLDLELDLWITDFQY